ncbi:MAG TPA: hypothetical protein VFZ33_15510 [Chitinophagaceae bacterium]
MKKVLFLLPIIFTTIFTGCVLGKKSTDKSKIFYASQNTALIKEAAGFAVLVTYGETEDNFLAKDVQNKEMRNKITSLGSSVEVTYNNSRTGEIPDSNVTFITITLFGVTEVIYDFALREREFSDDTKNKNEYYFVKLADRIYYRRRPIPMM